MGGTGRGGAGVCCVESGEQRAERGTIVRNFFFLFSFFLFFFLSRSQVRSLYKNQNRHGGFRIAIDDI